MAFGHVGDLVDSPERPYQAQVTPRALVTIPEDRGRRPRVTPTRPPARDRLGAADNGSMSKHLHNVLAPRCPRLNRPPPPPPPPAAALDVTVDLSLGVEGAIKDPYPPQMP